MRLAAFFMAALLRERFSNCDRAEARSYGFNVR